MIQICRKHDIVAVNFQDHSCGDESLDFTAYGRVVSQNKIDLVIACWAYTDKHYKPIPGDTNVICFTIVKSAIKSLRVLS